MPRRMQPMRIFFLLLMMVVATGCATQKAVVPRALGWLQQNQHADGYWPNDPACPFKGELTSLALLALARHGEFPDSEEFGKTVIAGLEWLVARVEEKKRVEARLKGETAGPDLSPNENAVLCYVLSEEYGCTRIPFLKAGMETAAQWVIAEQNTWLTKGVSPDPKQRGNEFARLAWRVAALRSAWMAGVDGNVLVPLLGNTVTPLLTLMASEGRTLPIDQLTAVTFCLYALGEGNAPGMQAAVDRIFAELPVDWQHPPVAPDGAVTSMDSWYFQREIFRWDKREPWDTYSGTLANVLCHSQVADGHWDIPAGSLPANHAQWSQFYTTPLCAMMLCPEYRWRAPGPRFKALMQQSTDWDKEGLPLR